MPTPAQPPDDLVDRAAAIIDTFIAARDLLDGCTLNEQGRRVVLDRDLTTQVEIPFQLKGVPNATGLPVTVTLVCQARPPEWELLARVHVEPGYFTHQNAARLARLIEQVAELAKNLHGMKS